MAPQHNRLLIDEPPLQVLPTLAVRIGLNEAIFVQQLHYLLRGALERSRGKIIDGQPWIYNTMDAWLHTFPFWARNTIRRTIQTLVEAGIVREGNFNEELSRRKWYTLDYEQLGTVILKTERPEPALSFGERMKRHRMSQVETYDAERPNLGSSYVPTWDDDSYITKTPSKNIRAQAHTVPSFACRTCDATFTGTWKAAQSLGWHKDGKIAAEGITEAICPACWQPKPKPALPWVDFHEAIKATLKVADWRAAQILHGDKQHARCGGLLAFEAGRQGKGREALDYAALVRDVAAFWGWYQAKFPGTELKDCAKVEEHWTNWRAETVIASAAAPISFKADCSWCGGSGLVRIMEQPGQPPRPLRASALLPAGAILTTQPCTCGESNG